MNRTMLVIASMLALMSFAGTSQADLIAGWDFSQYFTAGRMTIDGTTYVNTLPANYSSLDPTFEAGGVGSASAGTLYMDGTFGSTGINPAPGSSSVVPAARRVGDYGSDIADIPVGEGSITSNQNGAGLNAFNSFSILRTEGQTNAELLALAANSATTLVFEADASTIGTAENWSVSFGARSLNYEGNSTIDVSFAPNCSGFGSVTNLVVSEEDQMYTVPFAGANTGATGCVRVDLGPDAVIDNVSIMAVPEPGVVLSMVTGILVLAGLKRQRGQAANAGSE